MKKCNSFQNYFFILKECFKIDKKYVILMFLLYFLSSFSPILSALFLKIITDNIVTKNINSIINIGILYLIVMGLFGVISHILNNYFKDKRQLIFISKIKLKFAKKINQLDLIMFDDSTFRDQIMKTVSDAESRYVSVLSSFFNFIKSIISLSGLLALVLTIDIYLIGVVLVYVVILLFSNNSVNKQIYEKKKDVVNENRFMGYLLNLFRRPEFIQENRIYEIDNLLLEKYTYTEKNKLKKIKSRNFKITFFSSAQEVVNVMLDVFIIIYLGYRVYIEKISMGDFVAMMSSLKSFGVMIATLFMFIPTLKDHNRYIIDIRELLNYKATIEGSDNELLIDEIDEIDIKDVSFKYLKSNTDVLKNINIKIKKGDKIALVGENGAGKTTLIKLLMRLYDCDTGAIEINGKNIKEINIYDYRKHISVIFQNFNVMAFSSIENVSFDNEITLDEIKNAFEKVGIKEKIESLVGQYNTPLSTDFDKNGTNLSGGEKQKIAIARAILKNSDVIIMDEASSSLDPISENKINEMLLSSFKEKTQIIISHRLSLTKNCDKIFVIEKGEIIEFGTHKELMDKQGRYCEMFTVQSKNFQD